MTQAEGASSDSRRRKRITIVGPAYPYRGGIAWCTGALARALGATCDVEVVSFSRQYPRRLYPGGDDRDASLQVPEDLSIRYTLDILNPFSWLREGVRLRRSTPDAVIFVWWVWIWGPAYLLLQSLSRRSSTTILQCHNITDKEPSRWKTIVTNSVLRRADAAIVHAESEAAEAGARARGSTKIIRTELPVLAVGGAAPAKDDARRQLGISNDRVVLAFGHVRPFKAVDVTVEAWAHLKTDALLLVAGDVWWSDGEPYRELARRLGVDDRVRFDFRFVPDAEVATYFAAADVVVAPYRRESQSGVAMVAFHFGRPVIGSRVGGIPEIVKPGYNGDLVPADDAVALAQAIDRFYAGDISGLEEGARETARRLSWPRYASLVTDLLERVA